MEFNDIIVPFKDVLIRTFKTMLSLTPSPEACLYGKRDDINSDITGTIGIAGDISGTISLRFQKDLICRLASIFLNEEITEINEHVTDATGELTNIIAGSTKGILNETMRVNFKLSIPTTIMGSGHVLGYPSGSSIVIIPFVIDGSKFYLEICLKEV